MNQPDKLSSLFREIENDLKTLHGDYCIIGSAGLSLSGIPVDVNDLDILTSSQGAERLKNLWNKFLDTTYIPAQPEKFKSNFGRFNFKSMPIEVMGDLKVSRLGSWQKIKVEEVQKVFMDGISLPITIPSRGEQIRIFKLLGREKDFKKISLLKSVDHNRS